MDRLVLRIASASREVEAAVPADLQLSALVPGLVQMCEGRFPDTASGEGWRVLAGESVLPLDATLRQLGIGEGTTLRLVASEEPRGWVPPAHLAQPPPPAAASEPAPEPAPDAAATEVPAPVPLADRLRAVAGALVSAPDEPAESEPGAVDRLAVSRTSSPIERAHQAWEATDYRRRLESVIEAPRLSRSVVIAVVSPKGGVGKTTTALLLGTILATLRNDRVVAVDTDPDYGTLGRSFAPEKPMYVDDLAQILDQPALTVTMLDRFLSRAAHGLMVLPAPVDPDRMDTLGREDYDRVIARLREMVGIVVLDCGAGMRAPATRAALDAADQLVLVTDADPATASLVADVAHRLHDRPHVLVVNKAPRRGGRLNLDRLVSDVPHAGAVVEIDVDTDAASRASMGQFSWSTAQEGWQLAARELAAHLVAEWERLGLTAPPPAEAP